MALTGYFGAFARDLWSFVETEKVRLSNAATLFCPANLEVRDTTHRPGLAVLCHGLKGSQRSWHAYVEALTRKGWDVLLLRIPKGGNCPLQEAAAEPTNIVVQHLRVVGDHYARVALIGESNGTRIAHWIYHHVDWPSEVDVRIVSIAGFYAGIPWINNVWKVAGLFLDPSILQDYASSDPLKGLPLVPERTLYVATEHDTRFISTESSIPENSPHVRIYSHVGHCSVKNVAIADVLEFLES